MKFFILFLIPPFIYCSCKNEIKNIDLNSELSVKDFSNEHVQKWLKEVLTSIDTVKLYYETSLYLAKRGEHSDSIIKKFMPLLNFQDMKINLYLDSFNAELMSHNIKENEYSKFTKAIEVKLSEGMITLDSLKAFGVDFGKAHRVP